MPASRSAVPHDAEGATAVLGRGGDVVGIAAHAVAHDLGQDACAAPAGALQILEHQDSGAFAHHEAVAVAVPGARGALRLVVPVESARMAANPPIPMGVMHASVPPQIMASASPRGDDAERIADGMGAGGASRGSGRIRTLGAGAHGDMARSQVDDRGRNEERGNAAGAVLEQRLVLTLDDSRTRRSRCRCRRPRVRRSPA